LGRSFTIGTRLKPGRTWLDWRYGDKFLFPTADAHPIPCPMGPGRDSSVGIATGYGLDVPGVGEIFHTCPDRPWGPHSLLYNGYRVFPEGKEWPRRDADPSPPSSDVGHERVELYLYYPYGPYGLYRASVPVQGYTLLSLISVRG